VKLAVEGDRAGDALNNCSFVFSTTDISVLSFRLGDESEDRSRRSDTREVTGEIVERQVVFSPSRVAQAGGYAGERQPWPRTASSRTPCDDASRTDEGCAVRLV